MSTPYGAPPPAGPSASSGNGTLILVLGIISIILCQILGPVAWIMANSAMRTATPDQAGLINAGRICGIIGTVLLIVLIIAWFTGGLAAFTAFKHASSPTPPSY